MTRVKALGPMRAGCVLAWATVLAPHHATAQQQPQEPTVKADGHPARALPQATSSAPGPTPRAVPGTPAPSVTPQPATTGLPQRYGRPSVRSPQAQHPHTAYLPHGYVPRKNRRYSKGMMAGGIVLVSFGGITSLGGLASAIAADSVRCTDSTERCEKEILGPISLSLALGGLGLLAVGIPLTIVGSRRVPDDKDKRAWLVPTALFLGSGGGLRWTY